MKLKDVIIGVVVAVLLVSLGYYYAGGRVRAKSKRDTAPALKGATGINELSFQTANSDGPVKEGWIRLDYVQTVTGASTTAIAARTVPNNFGTDLIVDRVILQKTGTSSASFVFDMGTTTAISVKNNANSTALIDTTIDYSRATRSPNAFISSYRWATSTQPFAIDSLASLPTPFVATTTSNFSGFTQTAGSPFFDVNADIQRNSKSLVSSRGSNVWAKGEFLSGVLSMDQYQAVCSRAGAVQETANGCTNRATSTTRGFDLEVYVHWIATTTAPE